MDKPGDVAKQRQENVEPEVDSKPYLQKDADRRKEDREQYLQDVHFVYSSLRVMSIGAIRLSSARFGLQRGAITAYPLQNEFWSSAHEGTDY